MDLDEEIQALEEFVNQNFQPRREPTHPDGSLHASELGPRIHEFRYRAELFFLVSGYLDVASLENRQLTTMLPADILEDLKNAHFYWK